MASGGSGGGSGGNLFDETFPSFLSESTTDSLGPPVAISTAARREGSPDRRSDVQESYLEEAPAVDSTCGAFQDRTYPLSDLSQHKFALSFKEDLSEADDLTSLQLSNLLVPIDLDTSQLNSNCRRPTSHPSLPLSSLSPPPFACRLTTQQGGPSAGSSNQTMGDTSMGLLPPNLVDDLSCGLISATERMVPGTEPRKQAGTQKLLASSLSLCSFERNELEQHEVTDDDCDDLELQELKEYEFSKDDIRSVLQQQQQQHGQLQGQGAAAVGSLQGLGVVDAGRVGSREATPTLRTARLQDAFEIPGMRVAGTGRDCAHTGDDGNGNQAIDHEHGGVDLGDMDFPVRRVETNGVLLTCSRPGLEGGSSDEAEDDDLLRSRDITRHTEPAAMEYRSSAEGWNCAASPGAGGGGNGETGGRRHGDGDGGRGVDSSVPGPGRLTRSVAGGEVRTQAVPWQQLHSQRPVCGEREGEAEGENDGDEAQGDESNGGQDRGLDSMYLLPTATAWLSGRVSQDATGVETVPSTSLLRSDIGPPQGAGDPTRSKEEQANRAGPDPSSPHVVYQDERGDWVTDLAFFTPFDTLTDTCGGLARATSSDSDFFSGNDAAALIDADEEAFLKENLFTQEEACKAVTVTVTGGGGNEAWSAAPADVTLGMGDSSWRLLPDGHAQLRRSTGPDGADGEEGDAYMRLSLGTFIRQRSEALGSLWGDVPASKRPSFGYDIVSPERRAPFALIRVSDASSCTSEDDERAPHDRRDDSGESEDSAERTLFPVSVEVVSPGPVQSSLASQTVLLEPAAALSTGDGGQPGPSGREQGHREDCMATHPEESVLHISSIASAIASASLSADPMQLAAMIMQLSNKGHRAQPPGAATVPTQGPSAPNYGPPSMTASRQPLSVEPRKNLVAPLSPSSLISSSLAAPSGVSPGKRDAGSDSQATDCDTDTVKSAAPNSSLVHSPANAFCDAATAASLTDEPLSVSAWCASVFGAGGGSVLADESRALERTFDLEKYLKQVSLYDDGSDSTKEEQRSVNITTAATITAAGITPASAITVSALEQGERLLKLPPSLAAQPAGMRERRSRGAGPTDIPSSLPARSSTAGTEARADKPRTSERSARPSDARRKESKVSASRRASGAETAAKGEKAGQCTGTTEGNAPPPGSAGREKQPLTATGAPSRTQPDRIKNRGEKDDLETDDQTARKSTGEHSLGSSEPQTAQPEEAFQFRPSTSPLSHSSPGQGSDVSNSITTSTAPSLVCDGHAGGTPLPHAAPSANGTINHAAAASPCDASLSRLTYLSEGDSTLQNSICFPPHPVSTTKCDELSTTIVSGSPTPDLDATLTPVSSGAETQHSPRQTLQPPTSAASSHHHLACAGIVRLPADRVTDPGRPPPPLLVAAHSGAPTLLTAESLMSSAALMRRYLTNDVAAGYPGVSAMPHYTMPPAPAPHPSSCHLRCGPGAAGTAFPAAGCISTVPAVSCASAVGAGMYGMPAFTGILQAAHHGMLPGTHSAMVHMLDPAAVALPPPCRVLVPEELRFPNACCVGIAAQTSLSVYNPTERWLQVSLCLLSTSIDGEKVEGESQQCLVFKSQTVLGPRSSEDMRVLLVPHRAGVHVCVLSVASWLVAASPVDVAHAGALASRVLLTALAQNPHVQVEAGSGGQAVDFGDVQWGSVRVLPVRLTNRTRATVPVRLVISANAVAWRCFTFSRSDPETPSNPSAEALSAPSIVNLVMHAAHSAQESESQAATVWICFRPPARHGSRTDAVGPAELFSARVDVELDSPGPSAVISSLPLRARVGVARVHAPKHLQTLEFVARPGAPIVRKLPLQNVGNINVELSMKVVGPGAAFSVQPSTLRLSAAQESELSVSFALSDGASRAADSLSPTHGVLQILVLPTGPQYEVCLKGEVQRASPLLNIPPLLSNKQFLSWGGVSLGRAAQQKLTLRNNSATTSLPLRLLIRGQDHDCFQLQSVFGREERLGRTRELVLGPREDVPVRLLFVPTRRSCMLAKLEIKQTGTSVVPGVKFTIPLSGYGGCSHVTLEGARKMSDGYTTTLRDVAAGRARSTRVRLRNEGTRAAFARAVCFDDLRAREFADGAVFTVSPEHFVLAERAEQEVEVTCRATAREAALCHRSTALLAVVCFFCGDEIARQQFRRAVAQADERWNPGLSEENPLRSVDFLVPFPGEEAVTEVYDLPQRPNDTASFYGHMSRVLLSVTGRAAPPDSPGPAAETDTVDTGYADSLEDTAQAETHQRDDSGQRRNTSKASEAQQRQRAARQQVSTSLDVLPVRGPQSEGAAAAAEACAWSAEPSVLLLPAPAVDGNSAGHVTLRSHTSRALPFELSWPAHCLTVTPQQGVLDPQGVVRILVSPTPSTSSKITLPWSGRLYLHCDSHQQAVRVQIREDLVPADVVSPDPGAGRALAAPHATPVTAVTPVTPVTPSVPAGAGGVKVSNKTVCFPETCVGDTSKAALAFTNHGTEDVKWYLTSFAPPYVKGVAGTGDVFRATYATFRFSRMAGTLEAAGTTTVWAEFMPRDGGHYAQFWDLECHPEGHAHLRDHTRVQLSAKALGEAPGGGADTEVVPVGLVKTAPGPSPPRPRGGAELPPVPATRGSGKGSAGGTASGLYVPQELYSFPPTSVGSSSTVKVSIRNKTSEPHTLKFVCEQAPFHIQHSSHLIRAQHYVNLPVQFKPTVPGHSEGLLVIKTAPGSSLPVRLHGEATAVPQ